MTALRFSFSDLVLNGKDPGYNIHELYWAQAREMEILMDGPAWREPAKAAASLKAALADCPARVSVHPPTVNVNLADEDEGVRKASYRAYLDALELARELRARHVVVHPGVRSSPELPLYRAWQYATDAVAGLVAAARRQGIVLGLENVGHGGSSLFGEDEYLFFVEQFDPANSGYLVDTGHAHLNGWNLAALLSQAQTRLVGVHLHDNRGDYDSHLPVGEGAIAWRNIWPLLGSLGERHPLILEYEPGTPLATLTASCDFIRRETERSLVDPAPHRPDEPQHLNLQ